MFTLLEKDCMDNRIINTAKIHIENGNMFFHSAKYSEAIAEYNVALQTTPNDPNILYNKGVSLMKLKRHNEAIICFDKVMELHPNYFDDFNKKKVDNSLLENCA